MWFYGAGPVVLRFISLCIFSLWTVLACGDDKNKTPDIDNKKSSDSVKLRAFNDCTNSWVTDLSTQPLAPKNYTGDTHAAYGIFAFKANRRSNIAFKITGRSPHARFFSYETYEGPVMGIGEHLFDHEIMGLAQRQSALSGQPYQFILHHPRHQHLNAINQFGYKKLAFKPLRIRKTIKTLMFRIYAPRDNQIITPSMMPKIEAFNPYTGRAVSCPPRHHFKQFSIPQRVVTLFRGMKKKQHMEFGPPPRWTKVLGIGTNSAVNQYTINTSKLDQNSDVAVIKLNTPTSTISSRNPESRYWSFCFKNFARNQTLSCLPDFVAKKDHGSQITIVFARKNSAVEKLSQQNGYYFIEDTRVPAERRRNQQQVVGFVFRAIFSSKPNLEPSQIASGKICNVNSFLYNSGCI